MKRSQKRFIYTHKILFTIASLLFIVFVLPFGYWSMLPTTPLALFVIDKTTAENYREHASLFWLMQHWKYVRPSTGEWYDERKDYYGYFPETGTHSAEDLLRLEGTQLLYLADTYGVYRYPMEYDRYERLIPDQFIPISMEYGGLTSVEMDAIERYDGQGGMSIAEFNTLQHPQQTDSSTQQRLERMFGVHFTGALGRFYDDLSTAARWMKDQYAAESASAWNFSGRGIIIVITRSAGDRRPSVVVLQSSDLAHIPVFLRNSHHPFVRATEDEVPYYYFFEILEVDSAARTIASFEIQCTDAGAEKMQSAGLPTSFPAVVVADSTGRKLYFAGDFADNKVETMLTRYWNVEFLLTRLFSWYFVTDQTRFYWKFYLPMMKNVFEQAAQQPLPASARGR